MSGPLSFVQCALLLTFLWPLTLSSVRAESAMRVEIESSSFQSRTNGPIPLDLLVEVNSSGLTRGALHIQLQSSSSSNVLGNYVLPGLVLTSGRNSIHTNVAPLPLQSYEQEVVVGFGWEQEGVLTALPSQLLRVPGKSKRTFCILESRARLRNRAEQHSPRWLDLGQWLPVDKRKQDSQLPLQTLFGARIPDKFPVDPHDFLAYDVVVVQGAEFAELSSDQTEALTHWGEAGGAIAIFLNRKVPLSKHHVALLNRLDRRTVPVYAVDSKGILVPHDDLTDQAILSQSGWGRTVVVAGDDSDEIDDAERRRIVGWLWRLSLNQTRSLESQKRLNLADGNDEYGRVRYAALSLTATRPWVLPEKYLFPPSVRPVPGWLLALILLGFVLLIGPGDYFLLGAIRRHKWTWVVLPATTLGVTQLVVACSNYYLGQSQRLTTIEIRDLGSHGHVARTNRLSFLIPAERGLFTLKSPNGLATPFKAGSGAEFDDMWGTSLTYQQQQQLMQQLQVRQRRMQQGRRGETDDSATREPPSFVVTAGERAMSLPVERWTPVFFRALFLPRTDPQSTPWKHFNWDRPGDLRQYVPASQCLDALKAEFGPNIAVTARSTFGSTLNYIGPACSPEVREMAHGDLGGLIPSGSQLRDLIGESSPSGALNLEDLELSQAAPRDDAEYEVTLQVVLQENETLVVYRRRYTVAELEQP